MFFFFSVSMDSKGVEKKFRNSPAKKSDSKGEITNSVILGKYS